MPVRHIDEMGELYESQIVGDVQDLVNDTQTFNDSGPEAADGFEGVEVDPKNKKREKSVHEE